MERKLENTIDLIRRLRSLNQHLALHLEKAIRDMHQIDKEIDQLQHETAALLYKNRPEIKRVVHQWRETLN